MEKYSIQQTVQSQTEWSNGNYITLLSQLKFEVQEPFFDGILPDIFSLDQDKFRYSVSEFLNKTMISRYNGYQSIIAEECLKNKGWTSNQLKLDDIEDIKDTLHIYHDPKAPRSKNGVTFRNFFSLENYHVIERDTCATDYELMVEHKILPGRKYSIDVHLKIAELLSEGNSPKDIAKFLRKEYSSMKRARISKITVSNSVEILTNALSNNFILHPILRGEYSILVDSTSNGRGGQTLIVIQAVIKSSEIQDVNRTQDDQGSSIFKIPLYAKYIPSESSEQIISILKDFRAKIHAGRAVLKEFGINDTKLPQEPIAVVADFAKQLLPVVDQVWVRGGILKQGCHFHFEGIINRTLIEPAYKELRLVCRQLLSDIRYYAKKHHFRHRSSKFEQVMAEVLIYYVNDKSYGDYGQNLINTLEKFYLFRRRIVHLLEDLEAGKIQPHTGHGHFVKNMGDLLVKHNFRETNSQIRSLKQRLQFFNELRECLGESFDSEDDAKTALLELVDKWRSNADILDHDDLNKAAGKIEEYYELLVPALYDQRIPRTTSNLEGTHGQVKKVLRQWGGRSDTPSTFDWAASALTLLLGYDIDDDDIIEKLNIDYSVDNWGKLNLMYAISPSNWVKSSKMVTSLMSRKREILELSRPFKEVTSPKGFVDVFDRFWKEQVQ